MFLDDHVSQIDPHAKRDPALFGHAALSIYHRTLDLNSAAHGIHYARKFRQHAVAGVFYGAPAVFLDFRIDQFPEMTLEPFVRPSSSAPMSRE